MAKIGGTEINIGIGIETDPGTPVPATIYPKWSEFSFQAVSEKSMFNSQRGVRNTASSGSQIRRKFSEGSLSVVPNVEIAPYFFGLALGVVATGSISDSAYPHTITVQNNHASMKTATIIVEQGGEITEQYSNVVCNSLTLEVSDDFASLSVELIGGFPNTSTLTEAFTAETEFAYHQMTAKFGTSISNAEGNAATPIKAFSLTINNNVLVDEAFLSGANTPVAGGFIAGRLQITGSYTLQFDGIAELDKYKENTLNAMVIQFIGGQIGVSESEEIRIDLGRLVLTSPPKEIDLDGIVLLTQEFEVEYDATDVEITVIIDNEDDGTNY